MLSDPPEIGERYYAFVGLERQGGVMVYDVTAGFGLTAIRRCS